MEIQQTLIVTLKGKEAVAIDKIDDAVSVCAKFRDEYDYSFGMGANDYYRFKAGRVLSGKKQIAQIHFNGRIELI
jgi:hypothetical protein